VFLNLFILSHPLSRPKKMAAVKMD